MSRIPADSILGVDVRLGQKAKLEDLDQYFVNPIIHRQIQGDKIYVPLDLKRAWSKQ